MLPKCEMFPFCVFHPLLFFQVSIALKFTALDIILCDVTKGLWKPIQASIVFFENQNKQKKKKSKQTEYFCDQRKNLQVEICVNSASWLSLLPDSWTVDHRDNLQMKTTYQ